VKTVRLAIASGTLGYRALFNWIAPSAYIPIMLLGPLLQIVFFVTTGSRYGVESKQFYLVGNAFQTCTTATIFGMTMAIANERSTRTLAPILATGASRIAVFLGRGAPIILNGLLVSTFCLLVGSLITGVRVPYATLGPIFVALLFSVTSCTALGVLVGSLGLRYRDVFIGSNLVNMILLGLTGANIPLDRLPDWLRVVSSGLPLTHGLAAARDLEHGQTFGAVLPDLGVELLVGAGYLVVGLIVLRRLEHASRIKGVLDLW